MNISESIKELATALAKAQGAFEHAKKDVKNEFYKSKYADLASVISAAKKPLSDNGLSVVQVVDMSESGGVVLDTMLMHISGEWISGRYPIAPVKNDPQAYGSCIQYARRYAFSAITGIAADDDDGNGASGKPPVTTDKPPVTTQPPAAPPIDAAQGKPADYAKLLSAAATLQALGIAWQKIPHDLQPQFVALKDQLKTKLSPRQVA